MIDFKFDVMQCNVLGSGALPGAVFHIAGNGAADGGQLGTNLVIASGLRTDLKQGEFIHTFKRMVVENRPLSILVILIADFRLMMGV